MGSVTIYDWERDPGLELPQAVDPAVDKLTKDLERAREVATVLMDQVLAAGSLYDALHCFVDHPSDQNWLDLLAVFRAWAKAQP